MRPVLTPLMIAPMLALAASGTALPTGYMENRGQMMDQNGQPNHAVRYLLHRPGLNLQLRDDGFSYDVYALEREALPASDPEAPFDRNAERGLSTYLLHRIDVRWNGTAATRIEAEGPSTEHLGFVGPHGTVEGVRHYARVTYQEITPGIDLVFQLDPEGMPKYDVVVRPGGDISALRLRYQGADGLSLVEGALQIGTRHGPFVERIPVSHVLGGPVVDCHFVLHDDNTVGFSTPTIPAGATLVIDPWLGWGTYMGGSEWDAGLALASNAGGLYMAGETSSPITLATSGAHQADLAGSIDAFLARFDLDGTRLWCTYLGGNGDESAQGVAVDGARVYIGGKGTSTEGLATPGTHQTEARGGGDAFLASFTLEGQLQWFTWFGGAMQDVIHGVATANGRVHVVGWTESPTDIATAGAPQESLGGWSDAFLATFRDNGTLLRATYQGGASLDIGHGIAVEGDRIVTTGWTGSTSGMTTAGVHQGFYGGTLDAYLACHDTTGNLLWSTYYGGGLAERGYAVTLRGGVIHLGGATESGQYIATPGVHQPQHGGGGWDGFIARFTANGERVWGSYYGGYDTDLVFAMAAERDGVYATGSTSSVFVMGGEAVHQPHFAGGHTDAFVARFGNAGQRLWGTFYGGHLGDQGLGLVSRDDAVYMAGYTGSTTLISTPGAHQTITAGNVDALLARFSAGTVGVFAHQAPEHELTIHPNPASSLTTVTHTMTDAGTVHWSLTDATGAVLREGNAVANGTWTLQLDVSELAAGTYTIQMHSDRGIGSQRLVVAR